MLLRLWRYREDQKLNVFEYTAPEQTQMFVVWDFNKIFLLKELEIHNNF